MWIRSDLKSRAKTNLSRSYWLAFGVFMIFVGIELGVSLVASCLPFVALLVMPVLMVGLFRWYARNREATATPTVDTVFSLFRGNNYGRTMGSMLWMYLFYFLWSLIALIPAAIAYVLFFVSMMVSSLEQSGGHFYSNSIRSQMGDEIMLFVIILVVMVWVLMIPAIIKLYSYRMTGWILSDNPAIGYKRALKLSIELTRGQKWQMFVLDLSFIPWYLLAMLTFGIGSLFLTPYLLATEAELYATLRQNGVEKNLCTMEELGFIKT